ncbi:hypothetical protein GWC77_04850 [Paraburkholderia sp. NMBU_R16]|uniref:hypothetical protein n=1 Tax=Paraburkholderia sp. NMBU_R16 TaxID=2698676 RepID=UPI0015651ADA|nr:hypothetical protein [Paraburkholderia sp. NMBU_R16]NRO95265.1 hypothetical protein [Paraburkholderia sp. NMBU_R16]
MFRMYVADISLSANIPTPVIKPIMGSNAPIAKPRHALTIAFTILIGPIEGIMPGCMVLAYRGA